MGGDSGQAPRPRASPSLSFENTGYILNGSFLLTPRRTAYSDPLPQISQPWMTEEKFSKLYGEIMSEFASRYHPTETVDCITLVGWGMKWDTNMIVPTTT
jgi:hypothetical protein